VMTFKNQYIQTKKGLTLFTESAGNPKDPSIILIMGAMNQGLFWYDSFCGYLVESGYFVIRYDHRDTGYSSIVNYKESPYDLDDLTDDVLDIMNACSIEKAHIVGLSMGGYIGQLLGVNYPEKVRTLTLISTTADHRPYMDATMGSFNNKYDLSYPEKQFLDYLVKGRTNPPQTEADARSFILEGWKVMFGSIDAQDMREIARLVELSGKRSRDKYSAFNHGPAVANSKERISLLRNNKVPVPVYIFHGEKDPCFPVDHGKYLNELIPDSKLEIIKNMGHMFSLKESRYLSEMIVYNIKGALSKGDIVHESKRTRME